MKSKLIMGGCPKCGGALSQEEIIRESFGYTIEYACVRCGKREYREVTNLDEFERKHY